MLGRRRQKHQAKKLLFRRLKMNLIIISQDKKSIWDFSQCCIFIPNDSIHEIFIRPYYAPNGVSIATYEDPKKQRTF